MIYLIIDENRQFCKIGYAENPEKRLDSIQIGNPNKLYLLRVLHGNKEHEVEIHNHFLHLHKRGEWFLYMPEILEYFENDHSLIINN